MERRKVLLQWVGHSDLRALATSSSEARRKAILAVIGGAAATKGDLGPTKTLVETRKFDEIRLLSNYPKDINKWFAEWIGETAIVSQVVLDTPTDYGAIFEIASQELDKLRTSKPWLNTDLSLHLSPGTPAMAAVWLLLGKTRYPATFYQTYNGESWITDIPFDLIDVIPEVLRDPDTHLNYLAAQSPAEVEGFEAIAGESRAIRDAVGRAKRAAMRSVSVILLGESGTGKEMFAQAIHKSSPRRERPFKAINCAALSQTLLESELFGHCKGAFTGAERERKGAFEVADSGTLFLDEIGECDLETQAKLLRVLQPVAGEGPAVRRICRLGEEKDRTVDVRIVAATNRDLHEAIRTGKFREDLYYRLAMITIHLPPLRSRKSDLPKIAEHLLAILNQQFAAEELGYQYKRLSPSATAFVKTHTWPGNVRQLYNALMQAAVLSDGDTIGRNELSAVIGAESEKISTDDAMNHHSLGDGFSLEELLNSVHRKYLRRAMEESRGVKAKAARLLGIKNYQTLDAQLKRLGVDGQWDGA